ncbi:M55 family metallopeptidase [Streptomyces sp. NPDC054995]
MAADLWTSVVSLSGVALGGGLTALAQRATQRSAERAEERRQIAATTESRRAEPTADVLVADAHGTFRNLLPEQLDRRARLVRGKPRALNMLAGLDADTDAALFVGYHVRAGEGPGVLAHTMNGEILDVRVTGRPLGEIGLNAAMAGHLGVPVVLLSGDDAACAEAADLIPEAVTVPVKEALGMAAAVTLHPEEARDRLRRAAADAVSRRTEIPPLALTGPLDVEVDLASPHTIDLATLVPGVSRTAGARTVAFTAPDYGTAYRLILLLAQLATIRPA